MEGLNYMREKTEDDLLPCQCTAPLGPIQIIYAYKY